MAQSGDGLEDRLRGMILGNAGPVQHPQSTAPIQPRPVINQSNPVNSLAIHCSTGPQPGPDLSTLQNIRNTVPDAGGHKKLNQAQRRQMSSHLSIPIDPRPRLSGTGNHMPRNQQQNIPPQNNMQFVSQQQYQQQQRIAPSPTQHNVDLHYDQGQRGQNLQPAYFRPPAEFRPWAEQSQGQYGSRSRPPHRQLYQPGNSYGGGNAGRSMSICELDELTIQLQCKFLDHLVYGHVHKIAIEDQEVQEKEAFRIIIETICQKAIAEHERRLGHADFDPSTVTLKCFGSMASGFATKSSDMDLALLTPPSMPHPESADSGIPRILEKALLDMGYGTKLLVKTRVPIIKICEKPTEHLMSDLQEERRRFEQGLADETVQTVEKAAIVVGMRQDETTLSAENSPIEEQPHEKEAQEDKIQQKEPPADATHIDVTHADETLEEDIPEELTKYRKQLSSLRQKGNQSLCEYYGTAKRLLFRLGGQDVGISGQRMPIDLPSSKVSILNDVSKAFIDGIADNNMKEALLNINSPAFDLPNAPPVSLSGVYCQAEIERFAMKWESRPIREKNQSLEEQSLGTVWEWNQLSWQAPRNPTGQNRNLYQLLDRIKRINSLQFATLSQASYEDAEQYYARAIRLVGRPEDPSLLQVIIQQYVGGILDHAIRKRLYNLTSGPDNDEMSQKALMFHHNLLQLVHEYERALAAGRYNGKNREDVEAYLDLLKLPENLDWAATEKHFIALAESDEAAALTARVKELPSPTIRAKNRDRYHDHLSFPPGDSVGIQCDINFSADLALHNTHLLRCYSAADPRVRPLVLFVKSWASRRGINSPFRGTLSSYGYVLMVLHFLVNIARPFMLPNLQLIRRPPPPHLSPAAASALVTCNGLDVGFWRDVDEIKYLANSNRLNRNPDSVGKLLRGFFEYYANNGNGFRGFDWGREVLSLRTQGGLLTKAEKDWVGARTTTETVTTSHANPKVTNSHGADAVSPELQSRKVEEVKEVRHRYLFAIEDPFEIDHNVARTVNHDGICKIRDELRRAWRIIKDEGVGKGRKVDLLEDIAPENSPQESTSDYKTQVMDQILMSGLPGAIARGGTVAGYMARGNGISKKVERDGVVQNSRGSIQSDGGGKVGHDHHHIGGWGGDPRTTNDTSETGSQG